MPPYPWFSVVFGDHDPLPMDFGGLAGSATMTPLPMTPTHDPLVGTTRTHDPLPMVVLRTVNCHTVTFYPSLLNSSGPLLTANTKSLQPGLN